MTKEDTNAVIERLRDLLARIDSLNNPISNPAFNELLSIGPVELARLAVEQADRLARIGVSLEGEVASSDKSEQNKA